MSIRSSIAVMVGSVAHTSEYWIKEHDTISLCASMSGNASVGNSLCQKMACFVENLALKRANATGAKYVSKGVVVGGSGNGKVVATSIVKLPRNNQVIESLSRMGIVEVQ